MIVLNFEVIKQTVSQKNFEKLVNDSSNYVKLCFDFKDPDWSDICKRILFHSRSSETYCKEWDENHEVIVPWEVLTEDYFVFNLYGVGDESLRITTTPKKVSLGNSDYTDEIEKPLPPTPSVLDDIYNKLDNADSSISVIGESVEGLESTVSSHTTALSNLGDGVDSLESTVNAIGDDITTINGKLNNNFVQKSSTRGFIKNDGSIAQTISVSEVIDEHSEHLENIGISFSNAEQYQVNRAIDYTCYNFNNRLDEISDTVEGLESTVNDHSDMISKHEMVISNIENDLANFREDYNQKINNTVEMTVEYTDGRTETFDVVVK